MQQGRRLKAYLGAVLAIGGIAVPSTLYFFPIPFSSQWALAFLTLYALAVLGDVLALRLETSARTSMDFVAFLGAIPLLGPAGAVLVSLSAALTSDFILLKRPTQKALFNTAQGAISVAGAGAAYVIFGARPDLDSLSFYQTFPPFIVSVLTYFALNTGLVANVIAISEGKRFSEVWRDSAGTLIVFDLVMSPLAYVVAFLYVQWGALALLAAILPIIGLRYSYGMNIELQQLNQDLLRVLVKTLEARDKYTSGHSVRVAERSKTLAILLKLRPSRIRVIETAALLHDIGKIDLAYGEILRQAGPLTPSQRELIRQHPDKGVEIIRNVRSLHPEILACVRHHHEWFDGSGYPVGLAGIDIPLGARIIMISDSIDAMMTDRPYRAALSVHEIRNELLRNSGTQFDPDLVELTLQSDVLEDLATGSLGTLRGEAIRFSVPPARV